VGIASISVVPIKKNEGKKRQEKGFFSQLFWQKVFDMDFHQQIFNGVFELPVLRNAQKRHQKKGVCLLDGRFLPAGMPVCFTCMCFPQRTQTPPSLLHTATIYTAFTTHTAFSELAILRGLTVGTRFNVCR
jgi:hypothetical protein